MFSTFESGLDGELNITYGGEELTRQHGERLKYSLLRKVAMGRWHSLSILFHNESPHTYPELELLIWGDTDKSAMLSVPGSRAESARKEGTEPPPMLCDEWCYCHPSTGSATPQEARRLHGYEQGQYFTWKSPA